ncbi:MAG: hydrogenase 4 subunit F [Nitrospirota bacterium]
MIIPAAAALICLLTRQRRVYEYATVAGAAAMVFIALSIAAGVLRGLVIKSPGGMIYVDALSAFMLVIIALLSFVAAVYSVEYMGNELTAGHLDKKAHRYYYLLYNLFIFTMVLIPMANNLAILWMAIEGTTLVSALLVGTYRRRESVEAAWKYIILCTVGITFALLGTFIVYYASSGALGEGKGVLEWTALTSMASRLNPATIKLGFILIIVGYGTKAGLAPVHNWLPDAHSEAPTPISALLSGILLNCAFYGVMRFAVIARASCGPAFVRDMMFLFGISSVVVASVFMLIQGNVKRLLAYSSIEHMGIIALSFGVGGPFGLYASLLHILNHAIGKPLMFFVTGRIKGLYNSVESEGISGILKAMPLMGVIGFIGVMALAGAPPFSMFVSEFLMLRALAAGGYWYVMGVFLATGGLVFYGLLKNFGGMFLGAPSMPLPVGAAVYKSKTSFITGTVMFGMAMALVVMGIYIPGPLDRLITLSAGIIGG